MEDIVICPHPSCGIYRKGCPHGAEHERKESCKTVLIGKTNKTYCRACVSIAVVQKKEGEKK